MVRISGVDLPENKRTDIGLTYLYGIGRSNVVQIITKAGVEASKRIKDLTEEERAKIQRALDELRIEGDLRREIMQNIARLKDIGSYRGTRHTRSLPVRGQRTRTNARTKRGKRMTIGALKKEELAKKEKITKEKVVSEAKAVKEKK
ncbi:MAG: SSU ribosomal protein S13P [Microgenomates group bacterium GW2011_GWA1_Microgenomates_45_10]|nr:MAG: SSU ribosomal protein S13P [Microgenomates group bacterium GW2011_GWB1_44_8]KKT87427.1 MAG: SSU ribosomal protein S13P [Microgenomates group bacterium GW2011_GWA1_Microgenomates_45_10]